MKSSNLSYSSFQCILPTAMALVEDRYGQIWKCRSLLDSGTQSSFISENCAQRLRLRREKANITVTGLTSGNVNVKGKSTIVLRSMYNRDIETTVEVLIIKHLPTQLPNTKIYNRDDTIIENFELADPHYDKPSCIDILIGADKFFEILEREQKRFNSLILQKTMFGWIVSGKSLPANTGNLKTFTLQIKEQLNIEDALRKFWEVEDLPNVSTLTPEELECENIFSNTHQRQEDGRYIVNLPFKKKSEELGNSLLAATKRFCSLERKLSSNHELRSECVKQMREYIDLDHMTEIPELVVDRN